MKIIKRDGRKAKFDRDKIINAITKSMKQTEKGIDEDLAKKIADYIMGHIESLNKDLSVEEIQDMVEERLMGSKRKDAAKEYIIYRNDRTFERLKKSNLDTEIIRIIDAESEESTSNGNVDGSKIQSIRALISNVAGRDYSERHYIPKHLLRKQKKSIYIHDEPYFGLPFWNCCLCNWIDMFENGFDLGSTRIESPKSLATAINVLSQVASHVSSNSFGGTTFPTLVTGLTPYAKLSLEKHKKIAIEENISDVEGYAWRRLKKEIEDSMQSLEYEI